jgi:hypothetical protein
MALRRDVAMTAAASSVLTAAVLLGALAIAPFNYKGRLFQTVQPADKGRGKEYVFQPDYNGTYLELPWHLVDVQRVFPDSNKIETLAADVEFYDDVPESSHFFFVPIDGSLNGRVFYFGAITSLDTPTGGTSLSRERGFVFSRWGDKDNTAIRRAPGGYSLSSDHEGEMVSVRLPFPWTKGRYTFLLQRSKREGDKESGQSWVNAFVYSHATQTRSFVGALRFPGPELKRIIEPIGAFAEIFDVDPKAMAAPFPPIVIGMSDIRINGVVRAPDRVEAHYEADVPRVARAFGKNDDCPRLSDLNRSFPAEPGAFLISLDMKTVRSDSRYTILYTRK